MGKLPCPPSIITLGSSAHDVFQQAADLRLVVVGNVGEHAAEVTCALRAMRAAHPRARPGQLARHAFEYARSRHHAEEKQQQQQAAATDQDHRVDRGGGQAVADLRDTGLVFEVAGQASN